MVVAVDFKKCQITPNASAKRLPRVALTHTRPKTRDINQHQRRSVQGRFHDQAVTSDILVF